MDPPRVRTLVVEVTRRCDHTCAHCYNAWRRPGAPAAEDVPDLAPLLTHVLDQLRCHDVTLSGGEPMLRPDLPGIVALLAARGVRVTLVSHGGRLDRAAVGQLIDRGVALFEIPLLSHRPEVHDRLSGRPGAFDAAVSALTQVRIHGGQAVAVFVATGENLGDVGGAIELAFALGARGVMLNRYNAGPQEEAVVRRLMPRPEELAGALATADRLAAELAFPVSCSIPIPPCLVDPAPFPHLRFGFCAAGTADAYPTLEESGDVRPCNHSTTVLGNAWQEPMAEILSPARIEPFRRAIPAHCADCAERTRCQGGCRAAAEVCSGRTDAPEPFLALHQELSRPIR